MRIKPIFKMFSIKSNIPKGSTKTVVNKISDFIILYFEFLVKIKDFLITSLESIDIKGKTNINLIERYNEIMEKITGRKRTTMF